jgi:hypothetical protein
MKSYTFLFRIIQRFFFDSRGVLIFDERGRRQEDIKVWKDMTLLKVLTQY